MKKYLAKNSVGFAAASASAAALLCAFSFGTTYAQNITPGTNLVIDGIPPISNELVAKVQAYTEFKPSAIVAWHPSKPGMLIRKRANNSNQLHFLASPGAVPEQLTDFPDAVNGATFQPKKGEYILFNKATGGDEVFRIYRMDLATKTVTPISDEKERAGAPTWNRKGDRIIYATVGVDRNSTERKASTKLYMADPVNPKDTRVIATFEGGGWGGFRFSRDDRQLVYQEYVSANEGHLWTMDLATGTKKRVTPATVAGKPVFYGDGRFMQDGKGLYAVSDHDSEFRQLITIDLASGKEKVLTGHLKFDVDSYSVSAKALRIALITNEEGSGALRLLELPTFKELPRPALLPGEISALRWSGADEDEDSDGRELAVNIASARSPGDVYSITTATNKLTRWTSSSSAALNPLDFIDPKLVKWKSFDGLMISGFLYQPDAKKFPGKRPLIINIHGGPEGQARPGFINRTNYMVNELGIAVIFPNVRGSSGFGKTFLAMDNGKKREDSVKDIGALFDWIADQPMIDSTRVLVSGGSYGGYMSLAVSTMYPERIAGSIDVVGISNFVTFLTNTESYRRDLRRAEYGDERDPDMRAHLERISPLNNAAKIRKPLFVVQGRNDPRVPYTEAEQIVAQMKKQKTPVWFLMANDEGHGFAKKNNADFLFYAQIKFLEQTLLK
ncbi:MAG: S9 family peptidase [Betaproteobacteria bacterium]